MRWFDAQRSWVIGSAVLGYVLLGLTLYIYSGRLPDSDAQPLVENEQVAGNIIRSFESIRQLPAKGVFLIVGLDISKYADLPWEDDEYEVNQLGPSRYFELLTPDPTVAAERSSNHDAESGNFVLAEGDVLITNRPDYVLRYDGTGRLLEVRPVVPSLSGLESTARLIPELNALLSGREIASLSSRERLMFCKQAAYWGLFEAFDSRRRSRGAACGAQGVLVASARSREQALHSVEFRASDSSAAALGDAGRRLHIEWNAPGAGHVEIHVDASDGNLLAAGGSSGSADTGPWVTDATKFYLIGTFDKLDGFRPQTLATIAPAVARVAPLKSEMSDASPSIHFYVDPTPVHLSALGVGIATLHWQAPYSMIEIHVGSPDGPLFAREGGTGQAETGEWVTDKMKFVLIDDRDPSTSKHKRVLATVTVNAVRE